MRVAVTGASGFIGRRLIRALQDYGWRPIAVSRRRAWSSIEFRAISSPWSLSEWRSNLRDVSAVVHLIGHSHKSGDDAVDAQFRRVNVDLTRMMLKSISPEGLQRIVYLSSVKAVAEATTGEPIGRSTTPTPTTAYGRSKLEAEDLISDWSGQAGVTAVILRPPLIYGPWVKGNMRQLLRLADSGLPLPLAGIDNERSLLSLDNVSDAVIAALTRELSGVTRLPLADAEPISTANLIRELRRLLNRPSRLISVPATVLDAIAKPLGISERARKLTENLVISNSEIQAKLNWRPRQSTNEGLEAMVASYLATEGWTRDRPDG